MRRSPMPSSLTVVLGCGMQERVPEQSTLKAAVLSVVGPVSVELAELAQSTWNFHICRALLPRAMKKLGVPAVGGVAPSRSEGKRVPKLVLRLKRWKEAGWPASILARSNTMALGPWNSWVKRLAPM